MERLDNVVELYLKMKTNYALVITGPWGRGKTYYYKNYIAPKIEKVKITDEKYYRPLIISLFGQKSVNDIQTDILFELHSPFKGKAYKIAGNIGKLLAKGAMKITGTEKYFDAASEAVNKVDKSELINLEDIVLCFDDVERIGDGLNIDGLIGFVNTLVENNGAKVILIVNEEKFNEKSKTKYFLFKEKIVGNSIEFNPDIYASALNIINSKFNDGIYKTFLLAQRDYIVKIFAQGSGNLRTLNFILTYFEEIHKQISSQINEQTEKSLFERIEEIIKELLEFTITISVEYKESELASPEERISYKERKDLDWSFEMANFDFFSGLSSEKKKKENEKKSYRQLFIEKYFNKRTFRFYPSVYDFITGGDVFQYPTLLKELKEVYKIKDSTILPEYIAMQKHNHPNVLKLSDAEYKATTKELLKFSDMGKYSLLEYPNIFYCVARFGNPLKIEFKKLEKRITRGMYKGVKTYVYMPNFDMNFHIDYNNEYKDYIINIITEAKKINGELQHVKHKNDAAIVEKLFYSDFDGFVKASLGDKGEHTYVPFFKYFNVTKMYNYILSNTQIRLDFTEYLHLRYKHNSYFHYKSELEFFQKLKKKVDKKSKVFGKMVFGYTIARLHSEIESVITKLTQENGLPHA